MEFTINNKDSEIIIKRIFKLAYDASIVCGLGYLQAVDNASEDDVWNNVSNNGDYPVNHNEPGRWNADYVFGRMMKLSIQYAEGTLIIRPDNPQPSYNSWCIKYKTPDELFKDAIRSLNIDCN